MTVQTFTFDMKLECWLPCRHPDFDGGAFYLPSSTATRDKWKLIPNGIDVLITHGPPKGNLSTVSPDWFYLTATGLPRGCPGKEAINRCGSNSSNCSSSS